MYTVEQNDAEELVERAATKIEQLLLKRAAALEVSRRTDGRTGGRMDGSVVH